MANEILMFTAKPQHRWHSTDPWLNYEWKDLKGTLRCVTVLERFFSFGALEEHLMDQ